MQKLQEVSELSYCIDMVAVATDFLSHFMTVLILYTHRSTGTVLIPGVPEADEGDPTLDTALCRLVVCVRGGNEAQVCR